MSLMEITPLICRRRAGLSRAGVGSTRPVKTGWISCFSFLGVTRALGAGLSFFSAFGGGLSTAWETETGAGGPGAFSASTSGLFCAGRKIRRILVAQRRKGFMRKGGAPLYNKKKGKGAVICQMGSGSCDLLT